MNSPYKMKGKSPMMKALIGKQNRLPAELKAKILASPAKNKVVDTLKKVYDLTMPKGLKKINKKIADTVKGGKGKAKTKTKAPVDSLKGKKTKTKTKKQTETERYESDHINKKTGESIFKYKKSAPAKNYKKGYYGA